MTSSTDQRQFTLDDVGVWLQDQLREVVASEQFRTLTAGVLGFCLFVAVLNMIVGNKRS